MAARRESEDAQNLIRDAARSAASTSPDNNDAPLLSRDMKRRKITDENHRLLHRGQPGEGPDFNVTIDGSAYVSPNAAACVTAAAPAGAVTSIGALSVEVSDGSDGASVAPGTFAEAAATVEAAPREPTMPTVPTVPSVPEFPGDLTVPDVPTATWASIPVVPDYPFHSSATPELSTVLPIESATEPATSTAAPEPSLAPLEPTSQIIVEPPPSTPLPSETTFASSLASNTTSTAPTALSSSQGGSLVSVAGLPTTATLSIPTRSVLSPSGSGNPRTSVSTNSRQSTPAASAGTVNAASVNSDSRSSAARSGTATVSFLSTSPTGSVSGSAATPGPSASFGGDSTSEGLDSITLFASSTPAATGTDYVGAPGVAPGAGPSETATAASGSGDSSPVSTPQVVGGVVGGLAAIGLLLLLLLMILRRYRRLQGSPLRLPEHSTTTEDPFSDTAHPVSESQHSRGLLPVAAADFVRRLSGKPAEAATASPSGERGFQKISGRKLPSDYSPGMTSADVPPPVGSGALSGSSFYRDSQGFYGGPGVVPVAGTAGTSSRGRNNTEVEKDFEKAALDKERFMPSPARTPVVHQGAANRTSSFLTASSTMSPPQSPGRPDTGYTGLTGLSGVSGGGSRSSKFVEDEKGWL